jgi:hypothetical protein
MTEEVLSAEPLVASMYSIDKSSFAAELHWHVIILTEQADHGETWHYRATSNAADDR